MYISAKIFLCCLSAAAGTCTGFYFSSRLTRRRRILSELMAGLQFFKNEIYYTRDRLDVVSERTGMISDGSAAEFFLEFAGLLREHGERGSTLLWNQAVEYCFPDTSPLHSHDTEALLALGVRLGDTDVAGQCENIGRTVRELSVRYREADMAEKQKSRVYRTAGAAAGIMIAVLII